MEPFRKHSKFNLEKKLIFECENEKEQKNSSDIELNNSKGGIGLENKILNFSNSEAIISNMELGNYENLELKSTLMNQLEPKQYNLTQTKIRGITTSPGNNRGERETKKMSLVDPLSQKIISNLVRIPKVEERLLLAGEEALKNRQEILKKVEEQIKRDSAPRLVKSSFTKQYNNEIKEEFINRLTKYQDKTESKKALLKDKYDEIRECSFEPSINKNVMIKAKTDSINLNLTSKCLIKLSLEDTPTFKPKISKNSLKIALHLPPTQERLLIQKKEIVNEVKESHIPQINWQSKTIDNQNKKVENLEINRFDKLYMDSKHKKEKIENIAQKNQQSELKNTEECTFHPIINRIDSSIVSKEPIIERVRQWKENKDKRLENLKSRIELENTSQCSFKPTTNKTSKNLNLKGNIMNKVKAVDKYFERINATKKLKEEKMELQSKIPGSGKLWKRGITEVHEFSFANRNIDQKSYKNKR